jgi:hypothetical protein
MNEEPLPDSSLNFSLTQHLHDEDPELREVCFRLEVKPYQTCYYCISPNSLTLMNLLQINFVSIDELETIHKDYYETKHTSIFAWSSILGIGHYHWLRGLICQLPLNSKVDYLVRTI